MADEWSKLSYCKRRQVGALIVKDNMIISDGYNGTPAGFETFFEDEDGCLIYAPFESFGAIQNYLESHSLEIHSSGFERIPQVTKTLTPEQVAEVEKLLEKIEEDDDVQNVYHTMNETAD